MKESWKDIPGYDGKYQADTEGNIRRVYPSGKTRLLRPYHKHMSGSQRMIVKLTRDGKSREEIVMQLIAKTFLGVPPRDMWHTTKTDVNMKTIYRIFHT